MYNLKCQTFTTFHKMSFVLLKALLIADTAIVEESVFFNIEHLDRKNIYFQYTLNTPNYNKHQNVYITQNKDETLKINIK